MFDRAKYPLAAVIAVGLLASHSHFVNSARGQGRAAQFEQDELESTDPILPQIVNGDFELGDLGWTWDYWDHGEFSWRASGDIEIATIETAPVNHALQLSVHTVATSAGPEDSSSVYQELSVEQSFIYTGGDTLVASAFVGFGVVVGSKAQASFDVIMHLDNLTTGASSSVPIHSYAIEWSCMQTVALTGLTPWQEFQLDLSASGAELFDELRIGFSITADGQCSGSDGISEITIEVLIDDVAILDGAGGLDNTLTTASSGRVAILFAPRTISPGPRFATESPGDPYSTTYLGRAATSASQDTLAELAERLDLPCVPHTADPDPAE